MSLESLLKKFWGHDKFRAQQKEIIQSVLSKQDTFVLMPTGGGKSLCYQLPALEFFGLTIVISPLIALMKDQVDALCRKGIEAAYLNSSLDLAEQRELEKRIFFGDIKILYVSPERAMTKSFQELILEIEVSLIAIDEAHCVSNWGHDFRQEYGKLKELRNLLPDVPFIALTATATESTEKDIIQGLGLKNCHIFKSSFDRKDIRYEIKRKTTKANDTLEISRLIKSQFNSESGIIYCLSRKKTEELAKHLVSYNINAVAYHAGLSVKERTKIQENFLENSNIVIVATIAFGMGIDKPNIRYVIHFDMPKSVEGYYQEVGRASRDGQGALALMYYGKQELVLINKMNNRGTKSIKRRRVHSQKLSAVLGLCQSVTCRREILLRYFSESYFGPCGNCDNCLHLNRESLRDVTKLSLMILKVIHELEKPIEKSELLFLCVDQIENLDLDDSENILLELISSGAIKYLMDGSNKFYLTEIALCILEGKLNVYMRENIPSKKIEKKKVAVKSKKEVKKKFHSDDEAFFYLKEFRKKLAKKKRTKAFKIFPDQTLYEFVLNRPKNLAQLEQIYGVGPKKLKKYGPDFLQAIAEIS